jgi:3-hydroxyisobutyrate dehydrogenase
MEAAFLGLGLMGEPMAANLQRRMAGLVVWNRSAAAADRLRQDGAIVASSARNALRSASLIFLMLGNSDAVNEVLECETEAFSDNVRGRVVVNMGTVAPDYSLALSRAIDLAGGHYVECPVSGSRNVAVAGKLVAMIAGPEQVIEKVMPLVRLLTSDIYLCGDIPGALRSKLAVNLFLITMVTGLAEAMNFAVSQGVDTELFRRILDAGPMASVVSSGKLEKLVSGDMEAQAALRDVEFIARLIRAEAEKSSVATPMLDGCQALLENAIEMGEGHLDMVAVIRAIAQHRLPNQ